MREIKFRAWDNFNNRMILNDRILKICFVKSNHIPSLVVYSNRNIENHTEIREDDKQYCNEFELMQYTGLKDKNGKDIYEGDIISFGDNKGVVFYGRTKFRVKYRYYNNCYCYDDLSDVLYYNKVEIIGNIHVNKELIGDN
nr:MAG TPA: YopX protein [Caudoviricetes sp.]